MKMIPIELLVIRRIKLGGEMEAWKSLKIYIYAEHIRDPCARLNLSMKF